MVMVSQLYLVTSCKTPNTAWRALRNHLKRETLMNKLLHKSSTFVSKWRRVLLLRSISRAWRSWQTGFRYQCSNSIGWPDCPSLRSLSSTLVIALEARDTITPLLLSYVLVGTEIEGWKEEVQLQVAAQDEHYLGSRQRRVKNITRRRYILVWRNWSLLEVWPHKTCYYWVWGTSCWSWVWYWWGSILSICSVMWSWRVNRWFWSVENLEYPCCPVQWIQLVYQLRICRCSISNCK